MGGSSSRMRDERDEARRRADEATRTMNEAYATAERARAEQECAREEANRARREAQEARTRADNDTAAREQARRQEYEARQREQAAAQRAEEAQRAKEEAELQAHAWAMQAAAAAKARDEADQARRAAEERLMRGIPPDLRPSTDDLHRFRTVHGYGTHALNIAITGESGVGKSAMLNAVRGLFNDDEDAAEVGVNETTAVVQGYVDTKRPNVKWYDVPGANTPNVSGWMYFMDQHLYIFDVLVVLFSDRFTQTVGTILSNAHKCGIPTFLVRTKADQILRNLREDRPRLNTDAAVKQLVDETTKMANKNLQKLNLPIQPVYIISSKGMRKWVRDGDDSDVIDDKRVYEMILTENTAGDRAPQATQGIN